MKPIQIGKALMGLVFLAFLAPLAASDKHPSSASWSSSSAASSIVAESERKEREQKINVDGYERDAKEQAAQGSSEQDDVRPNSLLHTCLHKLIEFITTKASGVTGSSLTTAIKALSPITKLPDELGNKVTTILEQSWQQVWTQELPEHASSIFFNGEDPEIYGYKSHKPFIAVEEESDEEGDEESDEEEDDAGGVNTTNVHVVPTEAAAEALHAWNIETGAHRMHTKIHPTEPKHCVEGAVVYASSLNKLYHANLEKDFTITLRDNNDLHHVLFSIPVPSHGYRRTYPYYVPSRAHVFIEFINNDHIKVLSFNRITIYRIDYAKRTFTDIHTLQIEYIHPVSTTKDRSWKEGCLGHVWLKNGIAYFFSYATYKTVLLEKDVSHIVFWNKYIQVQKISGEYIAFGIHNGVVVNKIVVEHGLATRDSYCSTSENGRYLTHASINFKHYKIDIYDLIAGKKIGTIDHTSDYPINVILLAMSDNGTHLGALCKSKDGQHQNLSMWKLLPKAYPLGLPYQHKLITYLCKQALKNSKTTNELLDLLGEENLLQLSPVQRKPITDEIFATLSEIMDNEPDAEIEHAHEKEHKKRKAEESVEGDKQSPKKSRKNDSLSDK